MNGTEIQKSETTLDSTSKEMDKTTIEKIKKHFHDNKKVYMTLAIAVPSTMAVTLLISPKAKQVTNRFWSHDTTMNIIQTILERRGHPGNIVRCLETGEVFASQNRAADLMHLNAGNLSAHLEGKHEHVGGYHFERLGEAS